MKQTGGNSPVSANWEQTVGARPLVDIQAGRCILLAFYSHAAFVPIPSFISRCGGRGARHVSRMEPWRSLMETPFAEQRL